MTKSDYFCVLDPDDFWIDKHKIQKAVDFLEKNREYNIYVTDTVLQLADGTRKQYIKRKRIIDSSFDDFLNKKAALGCTLGSTFRNVVFKEGLPDKMINLLSSTCEQSYRGDAFRSIIHLQKGKAHCVPEVDAVYRMTDEGLWQGSSKLAQGLLSANLNKDMWFYFDKKYPQFLLKSFRAYNSVRDELVKDLYETENNDKKLALIKKMTDLYKIYEENKDLLKELDKKHTPFRYKFKRAFCGIFLENLRNKGFI